MTRAASDRLAGACLFLATAVVVAWQGLRLGVLWDLSAVLDTAYRISLGDLPYRDFPLPFAPLSFLVQAGVIRLFGRAYWHHVAYCAAAGGLATVLAWRVVFKTLRGSFPDARLMALLLCAPLAVLGVYCVFPHPFYDPDCCLALLASLLLLQGAQEKGFPPDYAFLAGLSLAVPPFVKQNMGLAFLGSAAAALTLLTILESRRRPRYAKGAGYAVFGAAAGLGLGCGLVGLAFGLDEYMHWTVRYAASRRMPSLAQMASIYRDPWLPGLLAALAAGASALRRGRTRGALALFSAPFAAALLRLALEKDASDRFEGFLGLWPVLLIAAFLCAAGAFRKGRRAEALLVFVLLATIHGALLSQQVWGSTYAIWPLFTILLAGALAGLQTILPARTGWALPTAAIASGSLLLGAGAYVAANARLDYVKLDEGPPRRCGLPALAGLSVSGRWLPDFCELVRFADREIPREDAILLLPGEDPFYYATGRRPRFPVLFFDRTLDPYAPATIRDFSRALDVRWLIVKRELQMKGDVLEDGGLLLRLLREGFAPAARLANYDVYRRTGRKS